MIIIVYTYSIAVCVVLETENASSGGKALGKSAAEVIVRRCRKEKLSIAFS